MSEIETPYHYEINSLRSWVGFNETMKIKTSHPSTPNELLEEALELEMEDVRYFSSPPKDQNWYVVVTHTLSGGANLNMEAKQ